MRACTWWAPTVERSSKVCQHFFEFGGSATGVAQLHRSYFAQMARTCSCRIPFDGWVAEKLVAVGEQISSGHAGHKGRYAGADRPVAAVAHRSAARHRSEFEPGQTVRFDVDSFPDRTFEATVRFIAPIVTNDTRSMMVDAMVPNPDGALRPGLFATAELVLPKKGASIFVPVTAVERTGEVGKVFVVRDGIARAASRRPGRDGRRQDRNSRRPDRQRNLGGQSGRLVHDGDAVRP